MPATRTTTLMVFRKALLAWACPLFLCFPAASVLPEEHPSPPDAPPPAHEETAPPAKPPASQEEKASPAPSAPESHEAEATPPASPAPPPQEGKAPAAQEEKGPKPQSEEKTPPPAQDGKTAGGEAASSPPPPPAGPPVLGSREIELRFRVVERGAAEIVGYSIHYTLDGGRSWESQGVGLNANPLRFRAPRDGRYGFLLSAVDAAGSRGPAPASGDRPALEAIVDTTVPSIRILRPDRPDSVAPDGRVEIEWEARDENFGPGPIEVASSQDGGPWETIWTNAPARGKRTWNVPLLPGEVRLRLRARDLAGNSSEEITPGVFRIVPGEGVVSRWVAVAPRWRSRRVPVYYRLVRDAGAGGDPLPPEEVRKVQVHYRPEGGLKWIEGGLDPDRRSPLEFEAPRDGPFELLLVALDRGGRPIPSNLSLDSEGRPDPNTPPQARVLVDTLEPRVAIEAPLDGASVPSGSPFLIRYTVEEENPRAGSTAISFSLDVGATWSVLAEGLDPALPQGDGITRGEFQLHLPRIESDRFLLKVQSVDAAGNVGEASTDPRKPIDLRDPREDLGRKAEEHYRRGVIQLRAADPAERRQAIESLRRALIYRPDLAAAHHDLAVALESVAEGGTDPGSGAAGDEPLLQYRKAHALAPDDPRFAFGLVGALLTRAEKRKDAGSQALLDEAEAVFRKISWTGIVELANEDREESQRLRRLYREWKEQYFNRIPRG